MNKFYIKNILKVCCVLPFIFISGCWGKNNPGQDNDTREDVAANERVGEAGQREAGQREELNRVRGENTGQVHNVGVVAESGKGNDVIDNPFAGIIKVLEHVCPVPGIKIESDKILNKIKKREKIDDYDSEGLPILLSLLYDNPTCNEEDARSYISCLQAKGVNFNYVDNEGNNALHILVKRIGIPYHVEIAKVLLKAGVDINKRNNLGQTPIILISKEYLKNVKLFEFLISSGGDPDIKDNDSKTALLNICSDYYWISSDYQIMKILLDRTAIVVDEYKKSENLLSLMIRRQIKVEYITQFCDKLQTELNGKITNQVAAEIITNLGSLSYLFSFYNASDEDKLKQKFNELALKLSQNAV